MTKKNKKKLLKKIFSMFYIGRVKFEKIIQKNIFFIQIFV